MSQIIRFFLLLVFAYVSLSMAFAKVEKDYSVDNKSTYHLGNDIDLVSVSKVKYYKPRIIIKTVYPRLASMENADLVAEFNDDVNQIIDDEIRLFKDAVKEQQQYQKSVKKSKLRNRLTIDFNSSVVNLEDRPIISVRFIVQGYITGLSHPIRRHRVVNYDIAEGRQITLSELFMPEADYLSVLASYADNVLAKKLRGDPLVTRGLAVHENTFRNWNITPSGIRITFDENTIAPYKYGSQKILVPYSAVKNIVDPDSSLGVCLRHRRRCIRDNLLTGGFIDEAAKATNRRFNPVLSS